MITYETTDTHPGTLPCATIYLGGLLCLSFDRANRCTVGVNNAVGKDHTWKFSIVEETRDGCIPVLEKVNTPDISKIHIDVKGGTTQGTYVYNGAPILASTEQRFALESYWIDLEGPRGHNTPVKNNTQALWPRFYINDGLFCASKLSTRTYALKDSNPRPRIKPLGNIALGIVADIFLEKNRRSTIQVKLPDETVSLDCRRRYQINISNDCGAGYAGPDETDFHLHYNAFSEAFGGPGKMKTTDQFHLISHNGQGMDQAIAYPDSATDRAPCMGVVLGQTSAFQ